MGVLLLVSLLPAASIADGPAVEPLQLHAAVPEVEPRAPAEARLREEHGWFIVSVTVDDGPTLDFVLDTGAGLSAVSRSTLERLGRTPEGSVQAQGASGAQVLPMARLASLAVAGSRSFNPRVLVLDDDVLTPDGAGARPPYDGVLGADVLADHDVLVDPVAGVLRLFEGEPAAGEIPPLADPVRTWRIAGPILGHDVEVNGSSMPAILDTGSRRVVVSPRGARNARAEVLPGTDRSGTAGVGTEEIRWQDVDLDRVRAGSTELGPLEAQVGALPVFRSLGFSDRAVVLLGNPALRGCAFLISYRREEIRYCRSPAGR